MAKKGKAHARHLPLIYPDTVRPPPTLPDAASLLKMGLGLTEQEFTVVRMGMAIHSAVEAAEAHLDRLAPHRGGARHRLRPRPEGLRRPARHARLSPGDDRVPAQHRLHLPQQGRPRRGRAAAVALGRDRRMALEPAAQPATGAQQPAEVWAAYLEHRRELGNPEAKAVRQGASIGSSRRCWSRWRPSPSSSRWRRNGPSGPSARASTSQR